MRSQFSSHNLFFCTILYLELLRHADIGGFQRKTTCYGGRNAASQVLASTAVENSITGTHTSKVFFAFQCISVLQYWFHEINVKILAVKLHISTIFCVIFSSVITHIVEKKFKLVLFFTRLFRGGEWRAYKIKPVLFLDAVCLHAAIKLLHIRKEKRNYIKSFLKISRKIITKPFSFIKFSHFLILFYTI